MDPVQELLQFIANAPTSFQAVDAAIDCLQGFIRLDEHETWQLEQGKNYLVTRNGSSVIAFRVPVGKPVGFQMVASHSDSPMFKLKEHAETEVQGKYIRLDTEGYGGMIMASWLDRPLSVAGRVIVRQGNRLESRLVDLKRDMALIPNVAIHMNREINTGYTYRANVDMVPLWGSMQAKGSLMREIAACAGCREEEIAGHDLFLYNHMPGTVWGSEQALFSAPRIDNLECAFASLRALVQAQPTDRVQVCAVFDNEEVGSTSRQGANSTFLSDTLYRIAAAFGYASELPVLLGRSFMVSADNAHAVHPNHPELADPANAVWVNEGIVIKHSANQKYTTDAVSEALFREVCDRKQIPVQHFANRSDMKGGSTLGNLSASHVSVPTLDIGLAQLAMHSCFETAGVRDLDYMIHGMKAFYETCWTPMGDGTVTLEA